MDVDALPSVSATVAGNPQTRTVTQIALSRPPKLFIKPELPEDAMIVSGASVPDAPRGPTGTDAAT